MERRVPLTAGETYHIFNRGAHKLPVFLEDDDYRRFQTLLFIANQPGAIDIANVLRKYRGPSSATLFDEEKPSKDLVDILAYTLMPNHFHLVLRQKAYDGISLFMRKLGTAYSMYFNLRHEHSGTLFQGRFKSSHIATDPYFFWIFAYVHLNPVALCEPEWKERKIVNLENAKSMLKAYRYSSYYDFYVSQRPERNVLAYADSLPYLDTHSDMEALLADYAKGRTLYSDSL